MRQSHRVDIRQQKRLFDDFFKIDEIIVSHQQRDGTMSAGQRRLVSERGDSVAALLYDPVSYSVVVVDQFKIPALIGRRRDNPATMAGWITETVAGMIAQDETPEEAVIRETMEETGYRIRDPQLICKFFPSPGGTSERIFLYFAEVAGTDRIGQGGGVDGEDIKILYMPAQDLFAQLAKGEIEDPKLAIAGYWLQQHLRRLGALKHSTVKYEVIGRPGLVIGYKTGPIDDIKDVSIWVNSENTDMMMDRFVGTTISARIRWLGANKEAENVVDDTIQEALRDAVGDRAHVRIGNVLVTEAGMLRGTHRVQRIFHVASTDGGPGKRMSANLEKLPDCVRTVLGRVDRENKRFLRLCFGKNLDSIVFPLLGAGDGGLPTEKVVDNIIPPALDYLRGEDPTLKEIYFLAFKPHHKSGCNRVLDKFCVEGKIRRLGNG